MLGSINEQYETKTGQAGMHIKETYRKRYNRARKIIQEHVKDSGWTPTTDDRYILVFDFSYRNEILQDIDGPRKASGDILQPMKINKDKRKEMTPEEIAVVSQNTFRRSQDKILRHYGCLEAKTADFLT